MPYPTRPRTLVPALLAAGALLSWAAGACRAGGGPEELLLVVNQDSPESMAVANHYIRVRDIPASNVVYLSWTPGTEDIHSSPFTNKILNPILDAVESRRANRPINCIAYSADFPSRVFFSETFGPPPYKPGSRPYTSITSATYLWELVKKQPKALQSPMTNGYCSRRSDGLTVSRAFDATAQWNPDGRRVRSGGLHYMLCVMLGVTYNNSSTVDQIRSYLSRSAEADGTRPKGTVYFTKTKDIRTKVRERQFASAIKQVGLAGVKAQLVERRFPDKKGDIIGVTFGTPQYDIGASHSQLLPGAIGDNLTSNGAWFGSPGGPKRQTLLTHFLNHGGAGASGTVVEPTANTTKFPTADLQVHYVHGCSMAESFYLSVLSPHQLMIAGDPLCQPFAEAPTVGPGDLEDGSSLRGTVSFTPEVQAAKDRGVAEVRLFVDGLLVTSAKPGEPMQLDTGALADGYHQLRLVVVDDTPLRSQGRWGTEIRVRNGFDAVQLSVSPPLLGADKGTATLHIASTVKDDIRVLHNGRVIDKVERGEGTLEIDSARLGPGTSLLVAQSEGTPGVRSKPLEITIP